MLYTFLKIKSPTLFSVTGALSVKIGGASASAVKVVGSHWITGNIPSNPTGGCLVDVVISFGNDNLTLPKSFCYL